MSSTPPFPSTPVPLNPIQPTNYSICSAICGNNSSKCGYCHGSRSSIIPLDNRTSLSSSSPQTTDSSDDDDNDSDSDDIESFSSSSPPKPLTPPPPPQIKLHPTSTKSNSYGIIFQTLQPTHYQQLIDKGWRRSGTFLYLPGNFKSCCPAHAIRLDVGLFVRSGKWGRVWRKVCKSLEIDNVDADGEKKDDVVGVGSNKNVDCIVEYLQTKVVEAFECLDPEMLNDVNTTLTSGNKHQTIKSLALLRNYYKPNKTKTSTTNNDITTTLTTLTTSICLTLSGKSKGKMNAKVLSDSLISSSAIAGLVGVVVSGFKIGSANADSGHLNFSVSDCEESKGEEETEQSSSLSSPKRSKPSSPATPTPKPPPPLPLQSAFSRCLNLSSMNANKLTVKMVPSLISATQPEVHKLYCEYQADVHGDSNPFTANDEEESRNSDEDEDDDDDSDDGALAKQNTKNNQRASKISNAFKRFKRFLCTSPLPPPSTNSQELFQPDAEGYDIHVPYGTYHLQYRVDGVLIAVGVVDVLECCLSSVYCFYSGECKEMGLGKFTALYEIEWVKRASGFRPNLKYYYLGFYIHSCPKMNYKAEYKPSEVRCPFTGKFIDYEIVKRLLNASCGVDCCRFYYEGEDESMSDSDNQLASLPPPTKLKPVPLGIVNKIQLNVGHKDSTGKPALVQLGMLTAYGQNIIKPLLEEFVRAVGEEVAREVICKF